MTRPCRTHTITLIWLLLAVACLHAPATADDQTWALIDDKVYGAKPDEIGPIGGGAGYANVVTDGDYRVSNVDQLRGALSKAKPGQTVFVVGESEIDCTTLVFTEELVIAIPQGVTLAGDRGHDGSKGALIHSDAFATNPLIRADGPDVRITGLRIRGPEPKQRLAHHGRAFGKGGGGHKYYYKFPTSNAIRTEHDRLEVDNCELSASSHAAIFLVKGDGHHIHHSFIHHNQYQGLGYGVCHDVASSLIEYNLFNYNRHSIAGTGRPGCAYEASNNVELGESLSHCFDMHGGKDRKDGTAIAGTWLKIHHNTFRPRRQPITIRGKPEGQAVVNNNWFVFRDTPARAVITSGNTQVADNAYGQGDAVIVK